MARYARLEEVLIVLVGGLCTAAVAWFFGWWALVPAVIALALLSFYRDPPRRVPDVPATILAAADGKVVDVSRDVKLEDGSSVLRIMIFLSVLNVHINRSPCAGRVVDARYRPGKFLNALNAEADNVNECNTLVIEPTTALPGPVRVRQIAGVLARRIVCTARPGDSLAAGERYGMIKLGSRTEICLPENPGWEVCVELGARVRAGSSILARLRPTEAGVAAATSDPKSLQTGAEAEPGGQ
jgi:phosphatidylserine decarboxylase